MKKKSLVALVIALLLCVGLSVGAVGVCAAPSTTANEWFEQQKQANDEWFEQQQQANEEWFEQQKQANDDWFEQQKPEDEERFDPKWHTAFIVFAVIFVVALGFVVYDIVTTLHLSAKSMGKRELPARRITSATVKTPVPDRVVCPKCGQPFGEAMFCSSCGTAKKVKNVYVVPMEKRMTAQKFEKMINQWFAENPYAYDCRIKLETKASIWQPFVHHKFFVKSARIEFSVAPQPVKEQYGLAFLYKFRFFGPIRYSEQKQVEAWHAKNPDCQIVSHQNGGHIQHFDSNGGIWAQYYNYVLYKK